MAGRRSISKQCKAFAAGAAVVLLGLWHAGPATAASNTPLVSDDITESANELDTLSPTQSLTPRIEAILRKVFKEPATPLADSDKPVSTKRPTMTTRVPGISDEQLARYKRQMYRTDI